VVIPINTATRLRSRDRFVHRALDDTVHWIINEVTPPELLTALAADDEMLAREHERLWYVACTRARELLVIPELPHADQRSWARMVDLAHGDLPELDLHDLVPKPLAQSAEQPNRQTATVFESERSIINQASIPISWSRPSDQDTDRLPLAERITVDPVEAPEVELPVGAGRVRGLVLHKLMEEVLTGELEESMQAFRNRAVKLIDQ